MAWWSCKRHVAGFLNHQQYHFWFPPTSYKNGVYFTPRSRVIIPLPIYVRSFIGGKNARPPPFLLGFLWIPPWVSRRPPPEVPPKWRHRKRRNSVAPYGFGPALGTRHVETKKPLVSGDVGEACCLRSEACFLAVTD